MVGRSEAPSPEDFAKLAKLGIGGARNNEGGKSRQQASPDKIAKVEDSKRRGEKKINSSILDFVFEAGEADFSVVDEFLDNLDQFGINEDGGDLFCDEYYNNVEVINLLLALKKKEQGLGVGELGHVKFREVVEKFKKTANRYEEFKLSENIDEIKQLTADIDKIDQNLALATVAVLDVFIELGSFKDNKIQNSLRSVRSSMAKLFDVMNGRGGSEFANYTGFSSSHPLPNYPLPPQGFSRSTAHVRSGSRGFGGRRYAKKFRGEA